MAICGGTPGGVSKSGSGRPLGDRVFFLRGTYEKCLIWPFVGGPQEELQNQVLAALLATVFSLLEEHIKSSQFGNLWGGPQEELQNEVLAALLGVSLQRLSSCHPLVSLDVRGTHKFMVM